MQSPCAAAATPGSRAARDISVVMRELHELIFEHLLLADTVAALPVSKLLREAAQARLAVLAPLVRPLLVAPFGISPGGVLYATRLDLDGKVLAI